MKIYGARSDGCFKSQWLRMKRKVLVFYTTFGPNLRCDGEVKNIVQSHFFQLRFFSKMRSFVSQGSLRCLQMLQNAAA